MRTTALETDPTLSDDATARRLSSPLDVGGGEPFRSSARAALVISLDFELLWGMSDTPYADRYRANILGARQAIPLMLEVFREFEVHATWATVGMLMYDTKRELLRSLPTLRPSYRRGQLSAYAYLEDVGTSEKDDPLHFGRSLVDQILLTPGQELASHTFSHYYCLEAGQTVDQFRADLDRSVQRIAELADPPRSLVFPRNQCNPAYLEACRDAGLAVVRGNQARWTHDVDGNQVNRVAQRLVRFGDSFLPLTADRGVIAEQRGGVWDVPASRFFRAFDPCLPGMESFRMQRLIKAMDDSFAAGRAFHLWWHPHNFGRQIGQNIQALRQLLGHFRRVADGRNIPSCTMAEYVDLVKAA